MQQSRLLIVSNRLPVSADLVEGDVRLLPASGGLATGLAPWHAASNGLWIGWPGDVSAWTTVQREQLDRDLAQRAVVPVHLSKDEVDRFDGFANRVLWPLFHYLIDRVPVDASGWDAYRAVNENFATVVAREHRPGDTIWVHDYQLMLLPTLLRERLPDARIGFFLHIPFPSSEVFRTLPWRRQILEGLLGADLIGFHTFAYMRHFLASLLHIEGIEADVDRVRTERSRNAGAGGIGSCVYSAADSPARRARARHGPRSHLSRLSRGDDSGEHQRQRSRHEAEERTHLRLVQRHALWKRSGREEQGHREADGGGHTREHDVGMPQA